MRLRTYSTHLCVLCLILGSHFTIHFWYVFSGLLYFLPLPLSPFLPLSLPPSFSPSHSRSLSLPRSLSLCCSISARYPALDCRAVSEKSEYCICDKSLRVNNGCVDAFTPFRMNAPKIWANAHTHTLAHHTSATHLIFIYVPHSQCALEKIHFTFHISFYILYLFRWRCQILHDAGKRSACGYEKNKKKTQRTRTHESDRWVRSCEKLRPGSWQKRIAKQFVNYSVDEVNESVKKCYVRSTPSNSRYLHFAPHSHLGPIEFSQSEVISDFARCGSVGSDPAETSMYHLRHCIVLSVLN